MRVCDNLDSRYIYYVYIYRNEARSVGVATEVDIRLKSLYGGRTQGVPTYYYYYKEYTYIVENS